MAGKSRVNGAPTKSKLPAKTNAKRNTTKGRKAMAASSFGVPDKKKYRLDDAPHARAALARVKQDGTPAEQKQVAARVARKYPSIQVTGVKSAGKKK